MKRKFSLANIPLLKIGPSAPESRHLRDLYSSPSDSRPATPRSVRPPLPYDVDAELRAACTYIVTHPKPSHEVWHEDASKPALDYAAIKGDAELALAEPVRKPSLRSKNLPTVDSIKYSYKPNVPTDELFKADERERHVQQVIARSRADEIMSFEPPHAVTIDPRAQPQQSTAPVVVKSERIERPRISARSDSVGTTGSTPQTDSTDYPWSASTAMTSAAITPARGSKRASSQNAVSGSEQGSVPKVDLFSADWMRLELEKHRKAIEDREKEKERERELIDNTNSIPIENIPAKVIAQAPTSMSKVPRRKPVPARSDSGLARCVSKPATTQDAGRESKEYLPVPQQRGRTETARADSRRDASDDAERRGRLLTRSRSRLGKVSQAASRAASRAASKAGSITNDILGHYMRPHSVQPQSPMSPTENQLAHPRGGNFAEQVKDYIRPSRPGTSMGNRKQSVDATRGHFRTGSTDSFHSSTSKTTSSEQSFRWKNWRPFNRNHPNVTTPDPSRPGSSGSAAQPRGVSEEQQRSPKQLAKPPVDLNRELPPLPSLDQWKAEEQEPVEYKQIPVSTKSLAPNGLRRVLSRKDSKWYGPASHAVSKEDVISARMGSPTPPLSQKQSVDVKRLDPASRLPITPASISPNPNSHEYRSQYPLQSRSTEPLPQSGGSTWKSRLRSKSNQMTGPDLHPGFAPNASTFAHSHVQATDNRDLVNRSRTTGATPISGMSRTVSRNDQPNSPYGHSRNPSNKSNAMRNCSVDDYRRAHDPQFPHAVEGQTKDKSKRKWWSGKEKRQQAHWTDEIVQPSAKNGMLLTDDAADAPVVRF